MKLTNVIKTSGLAWIHAIASQEILDASRAELARLDDPAREQEVASRWPDPLNPWAQAAMQQLTAARLRQRAVVAAQEAAIAIEKLDEQVKEAQASNAAL